MAVESYAVLGGEGFVGQAIVQELLVRHPTQQVASFGLTQRTFTPGYRFFHTNVTSHDAILTSLRASGATTVFHTVSPHVSASAEVCQAVNVEGTKVILEACVAAGVTKLVFTSSMTVSFDSHPLINADERMPGLPNATDCYVASKAAAEKLVLDANGKGGLLTCSLRIAGIFGPGDRQAIPGFIKVYHDGQTTFQIGYNQNLFDWVHVANVVHAHLLAADRLSLPPVPPSTFSLRLPPISSTIPYRPVPTSAHLTPSTSASPRPSLPAQRNRFDQFSALSAPVGVAGEAFLITNGEPIPFWTFAKAVWWEYAGHVPRVVIPLPPRIGMMMAFVAEGFAWLRGDTSKEGLTRVHVSYVGDSLYFNIEKARVVLGYEPIMSLEDGIKDAIAAVKAEEARQAVKKASSTARP